MSLALSISGSFSVAAEDGSNFYAVSESGVSVIDKATLLEKSFAEFPFNITDISVKDSSNLMLLSTSGSGIVALERIIFNSSGDFSDKYISYLETPTIPSNVVNSIDHVTSETVFLSVLSGVCLVDGGNSYTSFDIPNVTKVLILEDNSLYYSGDFGIASKKTETNSDWTESDLTYVLDDNTVPALDSLPVNDFDVLISGSETTLAIATNTGITVIREKAEELIRSSSVLQMRIP